MAIAGEGQEASLQAPITVHVQNADYDELERLAKEVQAIVGSLRGVRDPTIQYRPGALGGGAGWPTGCGPGISGLPSARRR